MRLAARIAVGALLLAGAGTLGFLAQRLTAERGAAPQPVRESAPSPDTELPAPPEARRKAIPETLPDITLEDREGRPRRLAEWSGRPLTVNFWATWCAPCRREIPLLRSLRAEHAGRGLEVVGVAVDFREAVLEYAREIGLDYPLLIGEQDGLEAVEAFGMDVVFPFSVFADSQGRIVAVKVGELHADEAVLILGRMYEVDAGRVPIDSARREIAEGLRELAVRRGKTRAAAASD